MSQVSRKNPYLTKIEDNQLVITAEGKDFLKKIITDVDGDVYAFTKDVSPLLVAAAMARLSRRGSDLRTIYLDEFAFDQDRAGNLIHNVVTGFGDDSVQQLMGIHLVVENASNLLTKKLEWGRFGAYLEQSTRYIFFDQKINGRYRYYIPGNLNNGLKTDYIETMDAIFELYSSMVRKVTDYLRQKIKEPTVKEERIAWLNATRAQACDAVRPVLPASTASTVGIFASTQAVENLIFLLLSETLIEYQQTGEAILREARKVAGVFLERTDVPERGLAQVYYRSQTKMEFKKFVESLFENRDFGKMDEIKDQVTLIDYWPKNELDLIPEMIFSVAPNLSLNQIRSVVGSWPISLKEQIFNTYIGNRLNRRHKPGRAIEKAHYEWEIVGDYGTFRDLHRHRVVDSMEWRNLNVDHGFDIPDLVGEAKFEIDFLRCFELSAGLFERMTREGYREESQYATLLGHKMRYRFIANARASFHIHELRTGPQGHPGYRKIVNRMHELLTEVHPRLGAAMKFVNKGEDPQLTRLAAELATQHKLSKS